MTHGDAVVILKRKTSPKQKKLEALSIIFTNELKHDYNCLTKPELWETVKFLYSELLAEDEDADVTND